MKKEEIETLKSESKNTIEVLLQRKNLIILLTNKMLVTHYRDLGTVRTEIFTGEKLLYVEIIENTFSKMPMMIETLFSCCGLFKKKKNSIMDITLTYLSCPLENGHWALDKGKKISLTEYQNVFSKLPEALRKFIIAGFSSILPVDFVEFSNKKLKMH